MGWKTVKRPKPQLNVPVGVAFDDQGQLVIPHHDLRMPDGRPLQYAQRWLMDKCSDGASFRTDNGLRVGALISEAVPAFGPFLKVSLLYLRKDPTWREITDIKQVFFGPDVDALMLLPREQHFVHGFEGDEDSHVFHVWQMPTAWAQELWPTPEDAV